MGLDHPHTKAGVGEFGVAISGGVWVAIRGKQDVGANRDARGFIGWIEYCGR